MLLGYEVFGCWNLSTSLNLSSCLHMFCVVLMRINLDYCNPNFHSIIWVGVRLRWEDPTLFFVTPKNQKSKNQKFSNGFSLVAGFQIAFALYTDQNFKGFEIN